MARVLTVEGHRAAEAREYREREGYGRREPERAGSGSSKMAGSEGEMQNANFLCLLMR